MIELKHIGKSADDLRFFILASGQHAGGVTVHSINPPTFSYGIAVSGHMRKKGVAKAALPLLFNRMLALGFSRAAVQIEKSNAASLALHAALGFYKTGEEGGVVSMEKQID